MIEKYDLNKDTLPNIPCPHDCAIKKVDATDEFIVFYFEEDISLYDSIKKLYPEVRTLIIRYHLVDTPNYYEFKRISVFNHKLGFMEENISNFINHSKENFEYLYHAIGYCNIIIKLWQKKSVVLDLSADYVEYEWIMKEK